MKGINTKSKKGFTLIELLVAIGILAVLAAIAIPSVAGLIDRANVSADNTNAKSMTNAIEQFTSEFELVRQDIASAIFNENDLDAVQSRIFNTFEINERRQIIHLENSDGYNGYGVNIDTKYPINEKTFKKVITNYLKTTSDTFVPKQSDKAFYYSPEIGVVIVAEDGSTTDELNKIALVDEDGVSLENIEPYITLSTDPVVMPLANDNPDDNIQWINLTLNALKEKNGETATDEYVATDVKYAYTTLKEDVLGYQEYDSEGSGLFVPGTEEYIKINVNGKQVDATWKNLIIGDYICITNGVLKNGTNASKMSGELVIGGEVTSIISTGHSGDTFLRSTMVTSVVLKEGVTTIGEWAFSEATNLKTITIPSTVTSIGKGLCATNSGCERIIVSENNQYYTSVDGVLYSKDMTKLICYPMQKQGDTFIIPDTVIEIESYAFRRNKILQTLYFGKNLETTKVQAIESTNIKDIYINEKFKNIFSVSFRSSKNIIFHLDANNSNFIIYDNCLYTADGSKLMATGYQNDGILRIKDDTTTIISVSKNNYNSIYMPKSVTDIAATALYTTSAGSIHYEGTEEEFNKIALNDDGSVYSNVCILQDLIIHYNSTIN